MQIEEILREKRADILQIATRYGASDVRVFGSMARGEARPDSDVDFLVCMDDQRSLLDLVAFWQDLEDLLGRKVDVVTERGLKEETAACPPTTFRPTATR